MPGRLVIARLPVVLLGAAALACIGVSCSPGGGVGEVHGEVHLADCGLDDPAWALNPDFFFADFIEDPAAPNPADVQRMVTIRLQNGSYGEGDSNGVAILLADVNVIESTSLGVPIAVGTAVDSPVRMTAYFNQSCVAGFPRDHWTVPGILEGVSGTLTMTSVRSYASADAAFTGSFDNVRFEESPSSPRYAILSGSFSFFYQRGSPAQRFP